MRSILDSCSCGKGVLLPRGRVPDAPYVGGGIGSCMDDFMQMPYRRPAFIVDFLSCNSCGARFDARDAGRNLADLRVYDKSAPPITDCAACPKCNGTKIGREFPFGKLSGEMVDSTKFPEGAYCTACNTVLGLLPPDPARDAQNRRRDPVWDAIARR